MCSNDEPTRHGPIDRVLRARSRTAADVAGRRTAARLVLPPGRSHPGSVMADRVPSGSFVGGRPEEPCPEVSR